MQLKESDKKTGGGGDDDFDNDDDFNDYTGDDLGAKKANIGNQIETKDGIKIDDKYQVTDISWSCNGSTLAVAYGKTDHISWCEHQSIISLWSIFQRAFDPKMPSVTIEVPNCLTSVEFHPTDPLLLAGGTINGEIFVWNLGAKDLKDKKSYNKSDADEYFHRESINRMIWIVKDESYYS